MTNTTTHAPGVAPPFLGGRRIVLRQLVEADADGPYPAWFNDAEVCAGNSHHVFPYSRIDALEYIRSAATRRDALVLAIEDSTSRAHIGNVSLQGIHPIHRTADLAIVIGDRSAWGTGVGREACELLVDHGFSSLGLHRVACATFEDNHGMRALARSLGMVEEGRRRAAAFKRGMHLDVIEFGILRVEWEQRNRAERAS